MKCRTDLFGRCAGCGRRLKRKSVVCSQSCGNIAKSARKPTYRKHHPQPTTSQPPQGVQQ